MVLMHQVHFSSKHFVPRQSRSPGACDKLKTFKKRKFTVVTRLKAHNDASLARLMNIRWEDIYSNVRKEVGI